MGVGGGGGGNNDGYPGALYDFQKEVLFPEIFKEQEAAQLEQLRGLQAQLSDQATGGLFADIDQLTAQAQSQRAITNQLESSVRAYNEDERFQFARANFGNEFAQGASPSQLTLEGLLDQSKVGRDRATGAYADLINRGNALRYRDPGVPASQAGFPFSVNSRTGREPRVYSSARQTQGRPEQQAYLSQFGGRVPKGSFFEQQARRRAAQGKSPIGAGSGLSSRDYGSRGSSGGIDLGGLIGQYLDEQRAFSESQRRFQQQQLGLQQQSLFQERQAFASALAQQQQQFESEQSQRQAAYDLALGEQRAAQEAAAEQQERIRQLSEAGRVRSNLAERQLSRAGDRVSGLRSIRSNIRQKRSASVSPTLGSRDLALGLFGQRRPR